MTIKERITGYNADEILFFLAVIFKPLYLLPSGSFQIGDFLFFAAIITHFLSARDRDLLFPIHREEHSLLIFVTGVLVINFAYFILIGSKDFLLNSAYYVFNFLIVLFAADILQSDRKAFFLEGLCRSCKTALFYQLIVYVTGVGKVYANVREMGTFNDPNQYAVYMLFCLIIILDCHHRIDLKVTIWAAIAVMLIVLSGSTGSLMGIAVILGMFALFLIMKTSRRKRRAVIAGTLAVMAALVIVQSRTTDTGGFIGMMSSRISEKLESATSFSDMLNFLIKDRVWSRVFEQPKYLLYGAGEGAHSRFDTSYVSHEIHSSILAPPFYYGIGVVFFLFRWFILKLRHVDAFQLCIYMGIIAESLMLVNYRQPLFWLLFVLAGRVKAGEASVSRSKYESQSINAVVIQ